ncbi:MAG: enoyl-CoA hydratase/isomerase family protein [Acidothermus sp.]|nr:enoyl-CoA hydratase/isomerase family protein [Acidothermus sp.]MCL6538355.1 enoyl-CoA hydratase/isomerase family protein [Acidothermus sp.]
MRWVALPPPHPAEPFRALRAAWHTLTGDVRVVVVHGLFAADVAAAELRDARDAVEWLRRPDLLSIALLDGPVTGFGWAVALAADIRVATRRTRFVTRDLVPGLGVLSRLRAALGYGRALLLATTDTELSATDAHRFGLIDELVDHRDDAERVISRMAEAVLAQSRDRFAKAKASLELPEDRRECEVAELALLEKESVSRGVAS